MEVRKETISFVDRVDAYSEYRLKNKQDIALLIQLSKDYGKQREFDDLTFHAKYIYRLFGIIQRTTPDSEAYPKLRNEFQDGLEKVSILIRSLIKEGVDAVEQRFADKYFALTHTSMENLINLSYDLSWIKNWNIDTQNESDK
jgi:hypothetical protein